ncbi:MAG: hypothetical protein M3P26_08795 [Gemmatimonadota bacterium]|nr:hypothetical protein [Gemmatimonadota bacterium]
MTGHDWLSRHDPAPPAELATAMRSAVEGEGKREREGEGEGEGTSEPTANDLLEAAERLLEKVLRTDCESRASALDLLTVDALMTHSLILANNDPETPEDFAEQAMRRVTSGLQSAIRR